MNIPAAAPSTPPTIPAVIRFLEAGEADDAIGEEDPLQPGTLLELDADRDDDLRVVSSFVRIWPARSPSAPIRRIPRMPGTGMDTGT